MPTALLFGLVLLLLACEEKETVHERREPAQVEHLENSELSRLTLDEKAVFRLGIQTAPAAEEMIGQSEAKLRMVVPYSALLYDVEGRIWVYENPSPNVYIRHEVKVDFIQKDKAVLLDGPPAGTQVVTVGAAELFGTEYEVGH